MTELVDNLYTAVIGTSSVPSAPGVMGPLQGSPGLLNLGGGDALSAPLSLMGLLKTGTTFASAASSYFGASQQASYLRAKGDSEAEALTFQSEQSKLDAKQAQLQGQQKTNDIIAALVSTLQTQRLNFSANGVDPTFGTAAEVAKGTKKTADLQLSTARSDAAQLAFARRAQAYNYMQQASAARSAGQQGAYEAMQKGYAQITKTIDTDAARSLARG